MLHSNGRIPITMQKLTSDRHFCKDLAALSTQSETRGTGLPEEHIQTTIDIWRHGRLPEQTCIVHDPVFPQIYSTENSRKRTGLNACLGIMRITFSPLRQVAGMNCMSPWLHE